MIKHYPDLIVIAAQVKPNSRKFCRKYRRPKICISNLRSWKIELRRKSFYSRKQRRMERRNQNKNCATGEPPNLSAFNCIMNVATREWQRERKRNRFFFARTLNHIYKACPAFNIPALRFDSPWRQNSLTRCFVWEVLRFVAPRKSRISFRESRFRRGDKTHFPFYRRGTILTKQNL